ncbi:MAG: hypothetical protein ACYTDY_02070 [Planctomycetota bacterium]|jgi:hypothetical protein
MRRSPILLGSLAAAALAVGFVLGRLWTEEPPAPPPPAPPPSVSVRGFAPLRELARWDAERRRRELDRQIEELGRQIEELALLIDEDVPPGLTRMPSIDAVVTGVSSEHDIVLLSVGREDRVRVGYEFTVFRGDEYVGKVLIHRVGRGWCSGRSKKEVERMPIRTGDSAKTRF